MGGTAPDDDGRRRFDKEGTRREILDAARAEFAQNGLAGARVDAIAARTRTVKRMIYYYFGSKEGLYLAVLESAYAEIRRAEQALDLLGHAPQDAIRRLVSFTFDFQEANPDFIRLVTIENIHRGEHMARSAAIRGLNSAVVEMLDAILERGRRDGLFRDDVDGIDVHMLISAFCFFRVANRHTFGLLFGRDLVAPDRRAHHKALVSDAVLRALERPDAVDRPIPDASRRARGSRRRSSASKVEPGPAGSPVERSPS